MTGSHIFGIYWFLFEILEEFLENFFKKKGNVIILKDWKHIVIATLI